MSRYRRVFSNAALALGAVTVTSALLAIVAEVTLRYRERHRDSVPGIMPLLFYRHTRMRHAMVRGMDYFGWVHVNAQGFRGTRPTPPAHDGLRLMIVGGSTTFDGTVTSDDRAWPARLEHYLGRLAPDLRIEVVNAGVPGYTIIDNLIRLETELYEYHPDVVLYYEAHNDLFWALRAAADPPPPTDTPDETATMAPWSHWLSRHSMLYSKVAGRIGVLRWRAGARGADRAQGAGKVDWSAAISTGADRFSRHLTSFVTVARSLGIRVALAEVVYARLPTPVPEDGRDVEFRWRSAMPYANPDVVMRGYERYQAAIREVAASQRAPLIRTDGFGLDSARWYAPDDPMHFNDAGADRMGRLMAQAVLERGIFKGLPQRPDTARAAAHSRTVPGARATTTVGRAAY